MSDARPAADLGVVLLNLGGPWNRDLVRPFLEELFGDREIIRLGPFAWAQRLIARRIVDSRIEEVLRNYDRIGGRSPLLATTVLQGARLEGSLARRGIRARVLPGMRYARPRAADTLRSLARAGVRRAVAVTLYPQFSKATTQSSLNDLARACAAAAGPARGIEWLPPVDRYPAEPRYVAALAKGIRAALGRVSLRNRDRAVLLFSAHGLPKSFADSGDPYAGEIRVTMEAVLAHLRLPNPARLSFQSRVGPMEWLRPYTEEVLRELGRERCRAVVVIPIAFVSDHIETLFEIEMLFGGVAREAGIREYVRVPALNGDPEFIEALADLVTARAIGGRPE